MKQERIPLVVISGNYAYRYVDGKFNQVLAMDMNTKIYRLKKDIEFFRVNGVNTDV